MIFKKLYFCRFLLEQGANVSAVNNDGELAIDISESDEMEELLQKEIDKQGIKFVKSVFTTNIYHILIYINSCKINFTKNKNV